MEQQVTSPGVAGGRSRIERGDWHGVPKRLRFSWKECPDEDSRNAHHREEMMTRDIRFFRNALRPQEKTALETLVPLTDGSRFS